MKINDVVTGWVDDTLKTNGSASGLDWLTDVSLHLIGGPDGNPMPMTSIVVALKSPLLGQYLSNMALLPGVPPAEAAVKAAVTQLLTTVLEQRNEVMGLKA